MAPTRRASKKKKKQEQATDDDTVALPLQRSISVNAASSSAILPVTGAGKSRMILPVSSVVKIFVVASKPNYLLPWQMCRQESYTGSGFILGGRRILTNAHVVRDYTTVRLRRHGCTDKWAAEVLCVNDVCDLALITVNDEKFWKDLNPLEVSSIIPNLYENVMVIGYPMGGDNICVTRGVVSRVTTLCYEDPKYYLHTPELMAIQIDAAINSGNSGGPVFDEQCKVVGVAFSGYAGSADNIGYIIPYPVITNFLRDFEARRLSAGVCDFGISYMLCENPSLRERFKVKDPHSGILVIKAAPLGPAAQAGLKEDDIILSVGGSKVANDGTIDFRGDERLGLQHKITNHPRGEDCPIEILRNSKTMKINVKGEIVPQLIEKHRVPGSLPSYFIVGGVLFTPLTCGLLDVAVESLSEEAWQAGRKAKKYEDQEIIVVIGILAHPVNHGYDITRLPQLAKFGGEDVRNMAQLVGAVQKVKKGFLHFTLGSGKSIILDAAQCREAEQDILQTYAIPSAISNNIVPVEPPAAAADDDTPAAPKSKKARSARKRKQDS